MVNLSRRKTILGMGLLASGSGAAFTSAAFSDSTESSADFRVVVDQQLVVQANGSPPSNVTTGVSDPSTYLFGSSDEHINTDNISFGDVQSNGEAAVNGETNGDLVVAVAVTSDETGSFDPILEVANQGDTAANVGVSISQYGSDVSSDGTNDQPIVESEVDSAFDFQIAGSSVSDTSFVEVSAGATESISIGLDLTQISESDLRDAASPSDPGAGDVFGDGAAVDTVDLVDAIRVGVEDTTTE